MSRQLDWTVVVITIITTIIMFFGLGSIALLDPDEPVYAETAKEMIMYGDFISPRIYGEFWFDKPPMYYWLAAAAFKLLGTGEFAARAPSAVFALLTVLLVYYGARRLFDKRTGMIAALVLASSIEFFYLGKAAVTDMTLTFFLTLALIAFLDKRYWLFYIGAALAVITKGPVGFLFPAGIVFLHLLFNWRFSELKSMKIPLGALLFFSLALPWYLLMYKIHGSVFIDTFIGFHNLERFTTPEHADGVLWYYFIPVIFIGFLPWSALLGPSLYAAALNGAQYAKKLRFLAIWAVFIFIFFSASQTKLVSYILPVYPPLAIIIGWYINRLAASKSAGGRISWPVMLVLLTAVFSIALYFAVKDMPELLNGAVTAGAVFTLMALSAVYYIYKRQIDRAFWVQVVGMSALSVIIVTLIFAPVAPKFHSKDIAAEFNNYYDGKSSVYIIKFLHPGFSFYSGVYGEEFTPSVFEKSEKAYIVVRRSEYDALKSAYNNRIKVLAECENKVLMLKME